MFFFSFLKFVSPLIPEPTTQCLNTMRKNCLYQAFFRQGIVLIIVNLCVPLTWGQINPPNTFPPVTSNSTQIAQEIQILVLGDSLSAEYGLERGTGWVSLLEKKLNPASTSTSSTAGASGNAVIKNPSTIVNASISGETTSGGRSRLALLLAKFHPKVLIIELGANDSLRGLPTESTKANLEAMVQAAIAKKCKVLLVGNLAPSNYGSHFNDDLAAMYKSVSKKNHIPLVPFMLKGVADVPNANSLFQADQLHPLAEAHPTILNNIWLELSKIL